MGLRDGLISWHELGDVNDSHLNGYHLSNPNSIGFVAGKVGNGAEFVRSEANNHLSITDANGPLLSPANSGYTMAGWVKLASDPGGTQFFSAKTTGSQAEFWVGYQGGTADTRIVAYGSSGLGNQHDAVRVGALTPGTWYFWAWWFDPAEDRIFFQLSADSAYESTVSQSSNGLTSGIFETTGDTQFGGDVPSVFGPRWLDGVLDQIGVWGRVLLATEREQLFNGGSGLSYAQLEVPPSYRVISRYRSVRR